MISRQRIVSSLEHCAEEFHKEVLSGIPQVANLQGGLLISYVG